VYDPKAEFERNELESITLWQQFAVDMGFVSGFNRWNASLL